jgi:hypothetical protein
MSSADTETLAALQALLEERQRYEGWLRTLDERRTTTPPHVFQRVYDDYTQRLNGVIGRLAEHREQVRETIATMTSELEQLRTRETERIDARTEAELRAIVGEYQEEEWTKIREDADLEIEMLAEERKELEVKLAELQGILESTEAPVAIGKQSEDQSNVSSVSTQSPFASATAAAVAAAEAMKMDAAGSEAKKSHSSSIAGLPNNGGSVAPQGVKASESSAKGQSETRPPSLEDFVDWPARRDAQSSAAQSGAAPRASAEASATTSARSAEPQSHDISTDSRRETEKTLKCPECGALNYTTEWYCERCGGELATF